MKEQLEAITKEKSKTEQRLNSSSTRITKLVNELKEEKQMNENLLHNQIAWQKKFSDKKNMEQMRLEKDREITDLKEQMRDVMFYLEAQNKVVQSPLRDEIQQGEVTIGEGSSATNAGNTPKSGSSRGGGGGSGRKKRGR